MGFLFVFCFFWCHCLSIFPLKEENWIKNTSYVSLIYSSYKSETKLGKSVNMSIQTGGGEGYNTVTAAAAAAKSLQSCPTLWDFRDGSPPGSAFPGILQVRTLEWVAISFSNAWKWKVKVKSLSRVRLLVTPWTAAYQAPLSMGFSRQEYWSAVPLPSLNTVTGP